MDRHLFLFGGSPPFSLKMAKQFAEIATLADAPISILFIEREGWERYMPRYTQALEKEGLVQFEYLPLPTTPIHKVVDCLKKSAGIIIGGGNTNLYADYIVDTAISKAIKERFELGVPVAGFSAGALISPELCVISPKDNVRQELQFRNGLGLESNLLVAVHFSQWKDENHLRTAVQKFKSNCNFGIDEDTCVYLVNGQLTSIDGNGGVYQLENDEIQKILV